jgi:hypothetical protein
MLCSGHRPADYRGALTRAAIRIAATVTCGQEQKVHAVDAATGKERWSRKVDWDRAAADPGDPEQGTSSVEVIAAAGTSLVMTDGLLWGPDGKSTVLTLLVPANGARRWERALLFPAESDYSRGWIGGYTLRAGGERYCLVGKIPGIWPGIIGLIDARSGDLTLSATGRGDVETIGVGDDGAIYATFGAYGKSRLTALQVTGGSTGFLGHQGGRWPVARRLQPVAAGAIPSRLPRRDTDRPAAADPATRGGIARPGQLRLHPVVHPRHRGDGVGRLARRRRGGCGPRSGGAGPGRPRPGPAHRRHGEAAGPALGRHEHRRRPSGTHPGVLRSRPLRAERGEKDLHSR